MTHNIQRGVQPGKRQLVDETDEEIAGLLEESASKSEETYCGH